LCAACQSQNFDLAKFLLSLPNIDLSVHDGHLKTPLILAARQGKLSLVQAIVSFYGDRINSKLNEVNQAIRSAMRTPRGGLPTDMLHPMESRILVILCLISIPGADVNSTVKTENLFLFAARHGSIELIDKLLQYPETEVNGYSQHGTALHIALEKSFQEIGLRLIDCDRVDLNYKTLDKTSALQSAIKAGNPDVLLALLQSSRFDPTCHDAVAALQMSILLGRDSLSKILLQSSFYKYDVTEPHVQLGECKWTRSATSQTAARAFGSQPSTPQWGQYKGEASCFLDIAVAITSDEILDCLLKHPSVADCASESLLPVMATACSCNKLKVFQFLLPRFDDNVNLFIRGQSMLSIAVMSGSLEVVEFLQGHATFDPIKTNTMETLEAVIRSGNINALHTALQLPGIDVNGEFSDGSTPLTLIAQAIEPFAIRSLEILGDVPELDVNAVDAKGRAALTEIIKKGIPIPARLAEREDVQWNIREAATGDTPLIVFAKKKEWKTSAAAGRRMAPPQEQQEKPMDPTLKMMLERPDIDVNAQNAKGNSAIMEAVISGNVNTFAAIASKEDCRLDLTNVEGQTVVALAGCSVPELAGRGVIIQEIIAAMDVEPKTEVGWPRIRAFGQGAGGGSFVWFGKQ
jgi:ankyrin repeat protein